MEQGHSVLISLVDSTLLYPIVWEDLLCSLLDRGVKTPRVKL